jgi:signal peptidase II
VRAGKGLVFAVLAPLLLGFDFASKHAVAAALPVGGEVSLVPGWISIFHSENPDIAFSVPVPLPLIALFGVAAVVAMVASLIALPRGARMQAAAIAALVAGALGNLLDRIGDGSVTDFVRLQAGEPRLAAWFVERFGTSTWPIFNVADVCILAGVLLWLAASATDEAPAEPVADPA